MYVVAGVTGNTGSVVADRLLSKGLPVRVIVRSEEKGAPWKARGAEVAVGSLEDADAVASALDGADAFYLLVPPDVRTNDMMEQYRRIADPVCEVVRRRPLANVVYLSTLGAQLAGGPFPMHYATEQKLRRLGVPVALRAGYFMQNTLPLLPLMRQQGLLPSFVPADKKLPFVAAQDIGETAAEALIERPDGLQIIELTGPEPYTMTEVAEAYSRALGKPIKVAQVPEDGIAPAVMQSGASSEFAAFIREISRGLATGLVAPEGGSARQVRGHVTLQQFVDEVTADSAP